MYCRKKRTLSNLALLLLLAAVGKPLCVRAKEEEKRREKENYPGKKRRVMISQRGKKGERKNTTVVQRDLIFLDKKIYILQVYFFLFCIGSVL